MKINVYCLVAALLGTAIAWGQDRAEPSDRSAVEDGVEVLTRGPVHEAFAGTIRFDPEPGVVVMRPVPEPVEELPPEQKPTGDNVAWIPGYWAWDDERDDFLWVSGIWRSLPPGRQWVSGYWATSPRESQWASGYWADAQASEIDYLPEPPQTVEAGPNIDAPSENHRWLPGFWIWQDNRYVWQPGYWATAHENWVWTPPHYVWAPRGYVFVDGFYDYPVARRGVLFAPVFFNSNVDSQGGYFFSPRTVINPAVFASHLFLRPDYGHYYFGDYYGNDYATRGFSPWLSYASSRVGYDPFFAHQQWSNRNDSQWNQRVESEFAYRSNNDDARPPRTWSDLRERLSRVGANEDRPFVVAATIEELAKSENVSLRFQPLAVQEREQFGKRGQRVREAREERRKSEAETGTSSVDTPVPNVDKPIRAKLPQTPVASQPSDSLNAEDAPPTALEAPQPDTTIEPQPRRPRGNVDAENGKTEVPQKAALPDFSPAIPKGRKAETRSNLPKGKLNADSGDPHPTAPRGTPKDQAKDQASNAPKAASKPNPPVTAPPTESKVKPRAESPKVQPDAAPTVTPKAERPKVASPKPASVPAPRGTPQVKPRPESPKDATPKAPKTNPKPESPNAKP